MTVSVVEIASVSPQNATSATLTLSSVPAAGDLIVVVFDFGGSASAIGVSGLGASWAQQYYTNDSGGASQFAFTHAVWFGTGATAAGTISASWTSGNYGIVRAFLVRGLPSTALDAQTTTYANGTTAANPGNLATTNAIGPSQAATLGQLVINFWMTNDTATTPVYPATQTPSGWTSQANVRNIIAGNFNTSYRIPGASASHQLTATSATAKGHRLTQLVIGGGATPPHGSGSGVFTWAGSGSGHRTSRGSGSGLLSWTGTATGRKAPRGTGYGALAWAGSASGRAPVVGGASGSGSGAFGWTGSATGGTLARGTSSGMFAWQGSASGAAPSGIPHGSGSAAFGWAGAATGHNGEVHMPPWAADLSRRTLMVLQTSGVFDHTPPLALPPAGFVERPIMRKSLTVPALATVPGAVLDPATGAVRVPDAAYDALEATAVVEEVGVPHVVFPKVGDINDVTYFRGGITRLLRDRREEPFGDATLSLELPQITSMDAEADSPTNDSPFNWTRNRANVEIVLRKSDGTIRRGVWTGHVVSHDTGNDESSTKKELTAVGSMWQASTDVHKVPNILDPTDVGKLVPGALNDVASRRYPVIPNVSTGINSTQRGSWSDSQMAYAQALLGTAWTGAGRQWTVAKKEGTRRTYEMRLKKATPEWTVTNGARGVSVDLTRDGAAVRNVIYGHGVSDDGNTWANTKYPNLRTDDAPLYPGTLMGLGATGAGVTLWQRRVSELGYPIAVDGTISSGDVQTIKAIQRKYGLTVDGVIGPQTWAATFDVGANGGDLRGVTRLPLAADPRTQRWLYNANGSIAGPNPAYDKNVIIYADDVDFGAGTTKAQGVESAQQIVDRESEPGLTGRITLTSDPREGSRLLIPPGDKITLVGYEQGDRVLHVTAVERDWQNLEVTLEVDEKSRDAMTWAQIRARNKEARRDPARRPGNVNRRSRAEVDQVVPFDGDSGAGRIPRHALYGGLWTVIRIPVSEAGRVAKIDVTTSGPACKFALALFGAPIQPAHLVRYVGDPLASDDPFGPNAAILEDRFGLIEGWGQQGQAAGYGRGSEGSSALTGQLIDTGGFEYVSAKAPWVWVAEYAASSCYISGRIYPAPAI